ncbi:hypothetical protein BBJ28_00007540 [Nothophytophthora sp. Chile5]|nr:hypothetical protein BBJ28_00007540 [Nothophytophthora sp. Chile5]
MEMSGARGPKNDELLLSRDEYNSFRDPTAPRSSRQFIHRGWVHNAADQMATMAQNAVSLNFYHRFHKFLKRKYGVDGRDAYSLLEHILANAYDGHDAVVLEWRAQIPRTATGAPKMTAHMLVPLTYRFLQAIEERNRISQGDPEFRQVKSFTVLPTKRGFEWSHMKMCKLGLRALLQRTGSNPLSVDNVPEDLRFYLDVSFSDGLVSYQCRKCSRQPKQVWKTGFSNLRKHLASCVGSDYVAKFEESVREQPNPLGFVRERFVSSKELTVFRWLEWVIMRDMPLSEVDNPVTRGISNLDNFCSNSLALYITRLVVRVEALVRGMLPEHFGIMVDGWTDVSTHYIGIIATFMEGGQYREVLLGCSPPLDEKQYTAAEHYELLEYVLSLYGRSISSPSVLIGDSCSTNKALADMMGIPIIGCGCHKLNLAVKSFLERRPAVQTAITNVDKVVTQLRNLKAAGALRELTPLCPIKRNVTRWSSTHKMLERFLKIEGEAKQLDEVDTIRRADAERIRSIMPTLDDFKSVMTDLQKQGQHIGEVQGIFTGMIEDYPELNDYIAADANISHSPLFESAVVKILDGKKETLTDAERALVARFVVRPVTARESTATVGNKRSYAFRLRERKRQRLEQTEEYVDLRFISGTSASAERLFSSAKHVLRSTRKRLTPVNFEKILFLKHNRFLWNADLVSQAMKGVKGPKWNAVERIYWRRLFNIKNFETANRKFAGQIVTDGKAVSIVMRKPKREPDIEQMRVFSASEFDVMWGLDPGRRDLFVATNQLGETVSCSTKEFYEEARYTKAKQKIKGWQDQSPRVLEAIRNMPTKKSASLETLRYYIRFMTKRMDLLLGFARHKPFRRLRLRSFIFMKRKLRQLCLMLAREGERAVVGFGDWSNQDVAGIIKKSPAGPVKRFERELARYCTEISIAEFRTSKVHFDCECELKNQYSQRLCWDGEIRTQKVHSVLHCSSNGCRGITVNRDANASRNMLRLLQCKLNGIDRPVAYTRQART